jgi:hypothetical protein
MNYLFESCITRHPWKAYRIGDTPLKIAINYGNFEIFDLLLQCDADVNIKNDK